MPSTPFRALRVRQGLDTLPETDGGGGGLGADWHYLHHQYPDPYQQHEELPNRLSSKHCHGPISLNFKSLNNKKHLLETIV